MTWLAWRQARAQAIVAAGLLAVVVVTLAATQGHIARTPADDLTTAYESLRLLGTALVGVPAAIGAFWGAPLLARELELGTHRLAWTQGITRRRWLATKLGVLGGAAAGATGIFAAAFTWWSRTFDATGNRIGTANFGQRGIVPVAYALFALALGTLAGAILRRTLPAMAVTLIGFFVARFSFQLLVRPRLVETIVLNQPTTMYGPDESAASDGVWVLSSRIVDASGHTVSGSSVDNLLAQTCNLTRDSPAETWAKCAQQAGLRDVVRGHPASQFWTLQLWETAAFCGLTIALVAACFWWVHHRTS